MSKVRFNKLNNILGWVVFGVSLTTYLLTAEPTVSFWDCGEYIATASNLEVGHPPGASLYQIIGAAFSFLNFGHVELTAFVINCLSGLCSAFAILFLFWSITHLLNYMPMFNKNTQIDHLAILGSAFVGSLAFTFSDTFWFSAVEGEVYAMATFFSALTFWLILKWESRADEPNSDRWLVLISFILGLSFGVHFMVLLTIPAIVSVYYFKKSQNFNYKDFILLNVLAVIIFGFAFFIIFPQTLRFFGATEIFFVNTLNLPFNSGTLGAFLLYVGFFWFALRWTRIKNLKIINTLLLCCLFLIIGTSSWIMLVIRANTNTPINENNPDSAVGLLRYFDREQYGDWPVLHGVTYTAFEGERKLDKTNPFKDGNPKYERDLKTGKYKVIDDGKKSIPNYDKEHTMLFSRMHSQQPNHIKNYKKFTGETHGKRPTFGQNMLFFLDYQIGYMYMRYFFWNFVGKQNGIQGKYDLINGNWKSGIDFIDEIRLGPQDNIPEHMISKANNSYYFLPLLLGIIGLLFYLKNDPKKFYSLFLFFFLTGIGIIIYTNVKPFEPRERDYAVVNSFYVFAIWIGMGVFALYSFIKKYLKPLISATFTITVCFLLIPVLMASENWDDHDRSNKYATRDMAKIYLDSVKKDAILFVHGDNDTFPLWYFQEVEGYRKDVKILNLSLLNTDWYIDQAKKKTLEAKPIPSQLHHNLYAGSSRDVMYYYSFEKYGIPDTINIKDWVNWIASDADETKIYITKNNFEIVYPSKYLKIPIDKDRVLEKGFVLEKDSSLILDELLIHLNSSILLKNNMVVLDIIANNNWERPIYFSVGGGGNPKTYTFLNKYFQLEGPVFQFVPIKATETNYGFGRVASEVMYKNFKSYKWGTLKNKDIYHDEQINNISHTMRINGGRLVDQLIKEDKLKEAEEILDILFENFPLDLYPINSLLFNFIENYNKVGNTKRSKQIASALQKKNESSLEYFSTFNIKHQYMLRNLIVTNIQELAGLVNLMKEIDPLKHKELDESLKQFLNTFNGFFNQSD